MIIDSSAILAILNLEPEAEAFSRTLRSTSAPRISAATLVETSVVAGPRRQSLLDELVTRAAITVVAFDDEQSRVARQAYVTYGKGSGSRARLNLGDCFSYALAKTTGQPLLFKGDDFTHTDIESALGEEAL